MTVELTRRERIERTLACQETDRVPLYDLLLCNGAIEYFSGEKLPLLADNPHIRETVQRMTGKAISRFLDMTRSWDFGPLVDNDYINEDGFLIHEAAWEKTSWVKQRPFSDIEGAVKFLERYIQEIECETREIETSPHSYREKFHQHFLENMARLGDTVHLITQQGTGLDEILWFLGFELMTYIMLDYSTLMSAALEALTNHNIAICHAIADLNLSPAVLTTPMCPQNRLTYSPTFLGRNFPAPETPNDAWHDTVLMPVPLRWLFNGGDG
jgi:hypothetical protein